MHWFQPQSNSLSSPPKIFERILLDHRLKAADVPLSGGCQWPSSGHLSSQLSSPLLCWPLYIPYITFLSLHYLNFYLSETQLTWSFQYYWTMIIKTTGEKGLQYFPLFVLNIFDIFLKWLKVVLEIKTTFTLLLFIWGSLRCQMFQTKKSVPSPICSLCKVIIVVIAETRNEPICALLW